MDAAFRIWASLLSLAVIVQVGLAGYGAFHAVNVSDDKGAIGKKSVEDGFSAHSALGYIIFLAAIVLVILAFLARRHAPEAGRLRWSGIILGLVVVQILLAWVSMAASGLGVLHAMNALAIAGVAGSLVGREWARHRAGTASAAMTA
jgi:heme A synthase